MSGQHHADRAKRKPGDLRAETSARVGLTAREQAMCRIEGFKMALRMLPPGPYRYNMRADGVRRWGDLFDAAD